MSNKQRRAKGDRAKQQSAPPRPAPKLDQSAACDTDPSAELRKVVAEKHERSIRRSTLASAIANGAMVLVTATSIWFVYRQLEAVSESNRIQARAVEVSNRPWVWVKSATISIAANEVVFRMVIANTGQTPALDLSINGPIVAMLNSDDDFPHIDDMLSHQRIDGAWQGVSPSPLRYRLQADSPS